MKSTDPVPAFADDTIDVIALCRLFWAEKLIIAIFVAVFGAVALVSALTTRPAYRAQVVVTPVTDSRLGGLASRMAGQFGGLASLAGIDLGANRISGQEAMAVLESRFLIEEFVRRNNLVEDLLPPGGSTSGLWHAVKKFQETVVSIDTDQFAGKTTMTIQWTDPAIAAAWANGLVALANELMRNKALEESRRNIEYLGKQVAATTVVEMQRVMYGLIENETKTLMLANARADYAFTVVDPAAVPEARFWPRRKLIVLSGIAIGLVLGALFALGRDTVRRYRVREVAGARGGT